MDRNERFIRDPLGQISLEPPLVVRNGKLAIQLASKSALSTGPDGLQVNYDTETLTLEPGSPWRLVATAAKMAGPRGATGATGAKGDKGDTGAAASLSAAMPVGRVEINTTGTNPATYLGFGTWVESVGALVGFRVFVRTA